MSREAAQEHDPGDILGPRSWDRLEPQLHRELGGTSPNPLRGFRRFPFYSIPAILLVAGVFYFVKQGNKSHPGVPSGGSPPVAAAQTAPAPAAHTAPAAATAPYDPSTTTETTEPNTSTKTPEHNTNSTPSVASPLTTKPSASTTTDAETANTARTSSSKSAELNPLAHTSSSHEAAGLRAHKNKTNKDKNTRGAAGNALANTTGAPNNDNTTTTNNLSAEGANRTATNNPVAAGTQNTSATARPHELTLSPIRTNRPQRPRPVINDSALRAYTTKSTTSPIQPGKNRSLHINKSWQFGLSIAPDFSSVNSLAGDKPGSTLGITVDYQFANRWYLSSGIFLDRKNYAARAQDYHVPYDYYRMNNLHNVAFVKGSFNMIEIPLNLRYDFSVAGNTLFFASAGISSYLLTNENCNYYFDAFGRQDCKTFNYNNRSNTLFASYNLSLGVEAGLSNNLSLVIAPYIKIPARNLGFGQVQMNSVGINFALKLAPTMGRKRK
ncbi:MAG: outer membrane beta-barrel protein [Bacteroidetes bacterium]|nr:outer membrane beta-barrel protein [Bacteroidota bacterium]